MTDKLFSDYDRDSDDAPTALAYALLLSQDGKTLFYPERYDNGLFTLYYRDANDEDAEPVKVDSDVSFYAIDKKAKNIYYIKNSGEDATLYHKVLKTDEKTKIASGVGSAFLSNDDLSRVLYSVEEEDAEDLFLIVDGGDPQRIDRGVESLEYFNENLDEFYYVKDKNLYYKKGDDEKVKIASDVYNVVKIYDSGEIYFTRQNDSAVELSAYFNDDMKDADAAIEQPVYPEYPEYPDAPKYPYWFDYETDEEYDAAYAQYELDYDAWEKECDDMDAVYDAACDQYWDDYDVYYEKLDRDYIREQLETYTIDVTDYELCYYNNGAEVVTVCDSVRSGYYSPEEVISSSPKILFEAYEKGEVVKKKMSEMDDDFSIYDLESEVKDTLYGSSKYSFAIGATVVEMDIDFDEDAITTMKIDGKGEYVYYFLDAGENGNVADLYRAPVTAEGLGTEELYDSEVYIYGVTLMGEDVVYYKDVPLGDDESYYSDVTGDLYINKQLVEYEVVVDGAFYLEEEEEWYYISDYDEGNECGTLKVYDGKESRTVANDVYDYDLDGENRLFYLVDYSVSYDCGTLYYYNGKESVKIDDDVACLIPVYQCSNILNVIAKMQ